MAEIVRCPELRRRGADWSITTANGAPVHEDRVHFEFLVLEAAQAGLSWRTAQAEGYRRSGTSTLRVARASTALGQLLRDRASSGIG